MPSSTFFRLPEEKRQRLLDAARAEFTRVPLHNISINRIVQAAAIPRGSFYQYFTGKEDLYRYLMTDMRNQFSVILMDILGQSGGDMFSVAPEAFDRLMTASGEATPHLSQYIEITRINPGMGPDWLFDKNGELAPEVIFRQLDLSALRRTDHEFVCSTFCLTIMALGQAIMTTLSFPEQRDLQRRLLQIQVDIIKQGSISPDHQGGTL